MHLVAVIFVQVLLLVGLVLYQKKWSELWTMLGQGMIMGLVIGLLSDLIWGKFFGLWSYTLGFGILPLTLTAAFVYGLFVTNILLIRRMHLAYFFIWTMVIMLVYEVPNYYFHVWTYHIPLPPSGFLAFLVVGYFGTAIFVAVVAQVLFQQRFFFIESLLKK